MADTVRQLMEAMIPELEDLESKGYFSRSEIKQIVKKRQDFEYALVRRQALKRDFLRCVQTSAAVRAHVDPLLASQC
jgi:U3 small nucleolar RNA-associated protein 6